MKYIFLAGILWGTIGIFVNELSALSVSVQFMSLLRMSFAFVIMFIISAIKHGKKIFILDKRVIFLCALLGLVCHGVFNICYSTSIKLNGVGTAAVLMYSAPVFTAAACRILFHESFSGTKIFALILNIFGCVLTVTGGNFTSNNNISLMGILAGVGSGFCYGMVAIIGKLAGEKTDSMIISAYSYFFAMIFLFVFARPEIIISKKILTLGFLYGLIPTSLAYLLYYMGLGKIQDVSRAPVVASIEPVTAVITGLIIYNEVIGAANLIGALFVLASIIIIVRLR